MRIVIDLQSCQNLSSGRGIGRYSWEVTKAILKQSGEHEIWVALSDHFPDSIARIREGLDGLIPQERIVLFSLPERTEGADPSNAWRTRAAEIVRAAALRHLRPDLVFITSLFEGLWDATTISVEAGPWLTAVTLYDLIPLTYPKEHLSAPQDRDSYTRKLHELLKADLLLPISQFVADEAAWRLGFHENRLVTAVLGADERFRPQPLSNSAESDLLRKHRITRPYVLTASPLEYRKNLEGFIAGYAGLDEKIRHSHQAVIIGKIDENGRRYLREIASIEGLRSDDLIFVNSVSDEDLVCLYSNCELFVFPSLSEGFGLPVLEAMACGVPVIASGTTSIPEVIGRTDATFNPADPGDITRLMTRALVDRDFNSELKAWGPTRAEHFSWSRTAAIALAAFESAPRPEVEARERVVGATVRRPRLAFVSWFGSEGGRSSGYARTILPWLSPFYDITPIAPVGRGTDTWLSANYAAQDTDWFLEHARRFDRILYCFSLSELESAADLILARPGTVLLVPQPWITDGNLISGRRLSGPQQRLLCGQLGFGGLLKALQASRVGTTTGFDAAAALTSVARGLLTEGELAFKGPQLRVSALPELVLRAEATPDSAVAKQFGIPSHATIVLGMAADSRSSAALAAGFRQSDAARAREAHLLICELSTGQIGQGGSTTLPGRVHRLSDPSEKYLDLLAGSHLAIVVASDSHLDARKLERDCAAFGVLFRQLMLSPSANAAANSEPLHQPVVNLLEDALGQSATRRNRHIGQEPRAVATQIRDAIERWAELPDERHELLSEFPPSVRGVAPNGGDLASVARSILRNEALTRKPQIFLDVTNLAQGPRLSLDPMRIAWTRNILIETASCLVEPIIVAENEYRTGRREVGRLLGLNCDGLEDCPVAVRPGDRVVGLGGLNPFPLEGTSALRDLVKRGALPIVANPGRLASDRPDLLQEVASLTVAAVLAVPSSWRAKEYHVVGGSLFPADFRIDEFDDLVDRSSILDSPIRLNLDPRAHTAELSISDRRERGLSSEAVARSYSDLMRGLAEPPRARPELAAAENARYTVTGHIQGTYSLALINRAVAKTLEEAAPGRIRLLPVETTPTTDLRGVPADEQPLLRQMMARRSPDSGCEIAISQHYPLLPPGDEFDLRYALFGWEESEVPRESVKSLVSGFDAVLPMSGFVAKALIDSGLPLPAIPIGLPSDSDPFAALWMEKRPKPEISIFLHVSSCFPRKGADVLLEAWIKAFTRRDRVRLVIKTFPNPHNTVDADVASLHTTYPDAAPIDVINRDVDVSELAELYRKASAVVLPTRGEGYNLPALEAMLAGVPLIVTAQGGHRDFCGEDEARLVNFTFARSQSHVASGNSVWFEPDSEDLARAMQEIVAPDAQPDIEARRLRARSAALEAADRRAWSRRLEHLSGRLLRSEQPGTGQVAWISSWMVRCGIATYSARLIEEFSPDFREKLTIFRDDRPTLNDLQTVRSEALYAWGQSNQSQRISDMLERSAAEAVVIQHQDGLIRWDELARVLKSPEVMARVTVVFLHNPRGLLSLQDAQQRNVIDSLKVADRVLVHRLDDLNLLKTLGLVGNTAIFPHGAPGPTAPPLVRVLDRRAAPIIGCHGFFMRHKGIDKLIRAVKLLHRKWPKLRLRLVCARFSAEVSDDFIRECQELATQLGIADAIAFELDFLPLDRVTSLLRECDLVVLPYNDTGDSASGAVRLAIGSLAPVLTTHSSIFDELEGVVPRSEAKDPEQLAQAISALLEDRDARKRVQLAEIEWLTAHDWARLAERFEGLVNGLIAQRRFS